MSVTIEGIDGSQWTASTWVARNALAFLRPALRDARLEPILECLESGIAGGTGHVSVRTFVEDPEFRARFLGAIEAAARDVEREGGKQWRQPAAYGPFVGAFARLRRLCRIDGNELLMDFASNPLNFRNDIVIGATEDRTH